MLKVHVHGGALKGINAGNRLATLDIGYSRLSDLATYITVLNLKGVGQVGPQFVAGYPRWSGSLWDLVARCLARCIYGRDQPVAFGAPGKKPAFAEGVCAIIEKYEADGQRGRELGRAEVTRVPGCRSAYTATLDEDILGGRKVPSFNYGPEYLNPADLLLRSICWGLHKCETLGPRPVPHIPPLVEKDGVDYVAMWDVQEPAKTGLIRYLGAPVHRKPKAPTFEPLLVPVDTYISFLGAA